MQLSVITQCGECQFWNQDRTKNFAEVTGSVVGGTDDWPPADLTVGICTLAKHVVNQFSTAEGFPGPMAAVDGSGFYAALWTRNTHGCLAGKAKEPT